MNCFMLKNKDWVEFWTSVLRMEIGESIPAVFLCTSSEECLSDPRVSVWFLTGRPCPPVASIFTAATKNTDQEVGSDLWLFLPWTHR